MKNRYVTDLQDLRGTMVPEAGGKAASLGELCSIGGIIIPDGFCLTTRAYREVIRDNQRLGSLLDDLSACRPGDSLRELTAEIRTLIENLAIPAGIAQEIRNGLARFRPTDRFAVRSSATAEDLPSASFAGQQDTFLNLAGAAEIENCIRKCWASLYTERAVIYRNRNGFDHRRVSVAVVIQQMIRADVSGILFTADPATSNRNIVSIEAAFGLGEALVSGLVNPDHYRVADGRIIARTVSSKQVAVVPAKEDGTVRITVPPGRQDRPALTDEQILRLERTGRQIEARFGCPQDVEWCIEGDRLFILQSRPVTTLFPIPGPPGDERRVYLSVGHNQMMTDAMKPLGLSLFLMTTRAPMHEAGGRLFIDITRQLTSVQGRQSLLNTIGRSDPLTHDALMTIFGRDFIPVTDPGSAETAPQPNGMQPEQPEPDAALVSELIRRNEESAGSLKRKMAGKAGPDVFALILDDLQELKKVLFAPENLAVITAAIRASSWINENMNDWLGEKNAADILSQSVPDNVTSAMGLDLMDLTDVIRQYPAVISYLDTDAHDDLLNGLNGLEGGPVVRAAIETCLEKYGMRCAGEIDITRQRWSENPAVLVPLLLSHIRNFEPGTAARKFEAGRLEADRKTQELLARLAELPDGDRKVRETRDKIRQLRDLIGYREYPKYNMVTRYWIYKQALLKEAAALVSAGAIREQHEVFYLTFDEFHEAVRTGKPDDRVIAERKEAWRTFEKLTPPRMITSEGEIISGKYHADHRPPGSLPGLPVSSGIVEGRARVVLSMEDANVGKGDILVTTFTDPSWTPLFVSVAGLVTEVGGLMTHGAVIAREYGLPAVVGVEHATKVIRDGQRIRVNGTDGYVEFLEDR